jgi:hypothetical protein
MKLLVTGGRGYADKEKVYEVMDRLHSRMFLRMVIHGAATGADSIAGQWARDRGVQEVVCPANWNIYKRRAGYLRNAAMADLKPDAVLAFPGNVGTNMMVELAGEKGIPVIDALDY